MESRITYYNSRRQRVESNVKTVELAQEHESRIFRFKNGRDHYIGSALVTRLPGRLPVVDGFGMKEEVAR